jgi:hypothetical protein
MTGIVMPSTCSQDRFAFISNMYKLGTKRAKYEQEMILMTISHRNSAGKTGANFSCIWRFSLALISIWKAVTPYSFPATCTQEVGKYKST